MNPVTPMPAMSRGGTFMRPGAMAWGHGAQDPATPAAIEDALAAAVKDPDRVTALLDELSRGRLWLPLPDASPVTDGPAVLLRTVTYLGAEFVPAFTSAERLAGWPCPRRRPARASGCHRGRPVRGHAAHRGPADPVPLLSEVGMALGAVPSVRQASRAWLSVPGQGDAGRLAGEPA